MKKRLFLKQFLPYDKVGMERYLEKQAQTGWLPDRSETGWVFYRTRPRKLRFSVYYCPEARDYYPELILPQKEFLELCVHNGWYLAKHMPGMLILCNEDPDPIPIETDPVMEVENIGQAEIRRNRKVWGTCLALLLICGWRLIQVIRDTVGLHFPNHWSDPSVTKSEFFSSSGLLLALFWLVLIPLLRGLEVLRFRLWYHKARKLAKEGILHSLRTHINPAPFIFLGMLVVTVLLCCQGDANQFGLFWLLYLCLAVGAVHVVLLLLDRPGIVRWVRATAAAVAAGALLVGFFCLPRLPGTPGAQEHIEVECSCPAEETVHMVNQDSLPLLMQELSGDTDEEVIWSTWWSGRSSPLLGKYKAIQRIHPYIYYSDPGMQYTIYHVKVPWLYETCLEEALYLGDWEEGNVTHINRKGTFGARYTIILEDTTEQLRIYQRFDDDGAQPDYVLCMEGRIVDLWVPWLLTDAQLIKVAEILGSCALPNI